MNYGEVIKSLIFWGPGAVLAVVIIIAIYKLAEKFIPEFIKTQIDLAEATGRQAQSMEGLKDSIQGFVTKDNTEHREIIILQKCIMEKIEHIEERIYGS